MSYSTWLDHSNQWKRSQASHNNADKWTCCYVVCFFWGFCFALYLSFHNQCAHCGDLNEVFPYSPFGGSVWIDLGCVTIFGGSMSLEACFESLGTLCYFLLLPLLPIPAALPNSYCHKVYCQASIPLWIQDLLSSNKLFFHKCPPSFYPCNRKVMDILHSASLTAPVRRKFFYNTNLCYYDCIFIFLP